MRANHAIQLYLAHLTVNTFLAFVQKKNIDLIIMDLGNNCVEDTTCRYGKLNQRVLMIQIGLVSCFCVSALMKIRKGLCPHINAKEAYKVFGFACIFTVLGTLQIVYQIHSVLDHYTGFFHLFVEFATLFFVVTSFFYMYIDPRPVLDFYATLLNLPYSHVNEHNPENRVQTFTNVLFNTLVHEEEQAEPDAPAANPVEATFRESIYTI